MNLWYINDYGCCPEFNEKNTNNLSVCKLCASVFCKSCVASHLDSSCNKTNNVVSFKAFISDLETNVQKKLAKTMRNYKKLKTNMQEITEVEGVSETEKLGKKVKKIIDKTKEFLSKDTMISTIINMSEELSVSSKKLTTKDYIQMERLKRSFNNINNQLSMAELIKELYIKKQEYLVF